VTIQLQRTSDKDKKQIFKEVHFSVLKTIIIYMFKSISGYEKVIQYNFKYKERLNFLKYVNARKRMQ